MARATSHIDPRAALNRTRRGLVLFRKPIWRVRIARYFGGVIFLPAALCSHYTFGSHACRLNLVGYVERPVGQSSGDGDWGLCIESNGNREEQYRTERLPHDLIDHNISFRRFLRKRIMPGRELGATIKTLHWLARLSREDSAAGADCPGFLSHRQPSPGLARAKAVEVRATRKLSYFLPILLSVGQNRRSRKVARINTGKSAWVPFQSAASSEFPRSPRTPLRASVRMGGNTLEMPQPDPRVSHQVDAG